VEGTGAGDPAVTETVAPQHSADLSAMRTTRPQRRQRDKGDQDCEHHHRWGFRPRGVHRPDRLIDGNRTGRQDRTDGVSDHHDGRRATSPSGHNGSPTKPAAAPTTESKQAAVPVEHRSALKKAESYVDLMHMSKQGVYDQLTSDYGEKFSAAAAQYAVDNLKADWNAQALASAKNYQDTMHMSPSAIHDQLTSEYGEKFTVAEADYAIAHLND
jgi:hypothetical protein